MAKEVLKETKKITTESGLEVELSSQDIEKIFYLFMGQMAREYLDEHEETWTNLMKECITREMIAQVKMDMECDKSVLINPFVENAEKEAIDFIKGDFEGLRRDEWAPKEFFDDFRSYT